MTYKCNLFDSVLLCDMTVKKRPSWPHQKIFIAPQPFCDLSHGCKSGTNGVTLSHVDSTIYEGLWRCIWIYNSFHDRTSQVWTWMHGVQFKMVHKSYSFAQSSLAYWKLTAVSLAANFAILLSPLFHLLTNSLSSPPDSLTFSPSVSCRKIVLPSWLHSTAPTRSRYSFWNKIFSLSR